MRARRLRYITSAVIALLTVPLLQPVIPMDVLAQPRCQTFKETGKTTCDRFMQYWQKNGGLPQQGYAISEEMQEQSETDGKTYTVQYFERAVFEKHPENQPPNDVLLSLLGNFLYNQKYPKGAPNQAPNNEPGSVLFKETGKRVGGLFLDYWKKNGALPQQGLPISDEFNEVSDLNGKTYKVQYFERAVFEYHPEEKPEYRVLLSQLGTFRYRDLYGSGVRFPTGSGQLTIWHSYSGDALQTLQKAIQSISSNNKDFKVTLVSMPLDQLQGKFIAETAKGTGPDLLLGPSEWTGSLISAKMIVPAENIEGLARMMGELQPVAVNASQYQGKLYGVPVNMRTVALIYNKDILKKPIAHIDEMLEEARKLTAGNVKYGLAVNADFYHTAAYNFAFGGKLFTDPNKVDLTTKGSIDWLTWLKKLKESLGVLVSTSANADQEINDLFKSGRAAMVVGGPETLRSYQKALGKDKVGVMVLPPTTAGGKSAPFVGTDNYYVSATSRDTRAVSEYIKYITSRPVQQSFVDEVGQLVTNVKANLSPVTPAYFALGEEASAYNMTGTAATSELATFLDQAKQGTLQPNVPGESHVWTPADNMVTEVVEGKAAPADAARKATEAINTAIAAPSPTSRPPFTPGVGSPFGVAGAMRWPNWGTFDQPAELAAQTGAGWVVEDFVWGLIEPKRGQFEWTGSDRFVDALRQRNLNIVGIISYSADWATPSTEDDGGDAMSFYPPDQNLYYNFVRTLVTRYKDKVNHWQVWNEPDNDWFWKPKPNAREYAALLKTAYRAIKDANPNAQVIGGAVSGNAIPFLEEIVAAGGGDSFDILSIHPYAIPLDETRGRIQSQPEVHKLVDVELSKYRSFLQRHNMGKKQLWVTEIGWPANKWQLDEQYQADYLAQAYAMMLSSGLVDKIFWYSFKDEGGGNDNSWGLVRWGNGKTDLAPRRPSFSAYTTSAKMIHNTTPGGRVQLAPYQVVDDFEQSQAWTRSNHPNGSFTIGPAQKHGGALSGRFEYNFTDKEQAVDFAPPTPRPIPGRPTRLGLWVLGDASGNYLSAWIKDAKGELFKVRLGSVGGAADGWRYFESRINNYYFSWEIHGGDGRVDYPVSFVSFRLENTPDHPARSGVIYVDDLQSYDGPDAATWRFVRGDGQVVDVLWSIDSTQVDLPTQSGSAQVTERDGGTRTVSASSGKLRLNVGISPIYVVHRP